MYQIPQIADMDVTQLCFAVEDKQPFAIGELENYSILGRPRDSLIGKMGLNMNIYIYEIYTYIHTYISKNFLIFKP